MGSGRGSVPIEIIDLQLFAILKTSLSTGEVVGAALMGSYLFLLITKSILAWNQIRKGTADRVSDNLTSAQASQIVIAQPILGGDPNLENTLRQNVDQVPSGIQFLWLVDETDPIGSKVAHSIAGDNDNVVVMVCSSANSNENPKTAKLQLALDATEHKYFVVLDDDTVIGESSLAKMVARLESFDLYTGLPVYRSANTIWGNLVAQFVNNNSVLTYLPLLNFCPPLSINGMFYGVDSEKLKQIGGFRPILNELCDDYALKKYVCSKGWRIKQGLSFQSVSTTVPSFSQYFQIMHRWFVFTIMLIKDQSFSIQVCLAVLLGLPAMLLLTSITVLAWTASWFSIVVLSFGLVTRQWTLLLVQKSAKAPDHSFRPGLSLIAELLQPFQSSLALMFPSIRWRGQKIRIKGNQKFEIERADGFEAEFDD
jgi:ceramide glucosyltransferase